jgi:hypothetical protein
MVEKKIKTIKHGFMVVSSFDVQKWDVQVLRILVWYQCGIQSSTKFSPYMIFIGRTPRSTIDNNLNTFTETIDDEIDTNTMVICMIKKMELISQLHESLLEDVGQTKKK